MVSDKRKFKVRMSRDEVIFDAVTVPVLIILMFIMLYPLLHVIFSSLSDGAMLMRHSGVLLWPAGFSLNAYDAVFKNRLLGSGYINTLINVTATIVINVSLTAMGAFALSRKELKLRRILMLLITFTMIFSGGLIPTYLLVRALHLTNTRWSLIIPSAISAYNLIIMRTYFEGIPESLFESARIDGANDFHVLVKIALPIAMPVVAVMILFYGVAQWNAWFSAYIYLRDRMLWPLQLVLREIVLVNMDDMITSADVNDKAMLAETVRYATIVVATVPVLFIYPFLQKYFVKGVMIGAIKG
jgi:putative aldouronate transport system permease protein